MIELINEYIDQWYLVEAMRETRYYDEEEEILLVKLGNKVGDLIALNKM